MHFVFLDDFKNSTNRHFFFFFFFSWKWNRQTQRLKIKRVASWKITMARENCGIVSKTQLTLALRKYCSNDMERYFVAFSLSWFSLSFLFCLFFLKRTLLRPFFFFFFLNWQSEITGLWNCQYEGNIGCWIWNR